jgi:hypothetical protein
MRRVDHRKKNHNDEAFWIMSVNDAFAQGEIIWASVGGGFTMEVFRRSGNNV